MKIKNLLLALVSLFALQSMAQDCTYYFPTQEGKQYIRNCYDPQDNLSYKLVLTVDKVYEYPGSSEVIADYSYLTASGRALARGEMVARCDDGDFYMDAKHFIPFASFMNVPESELLLFTNMISYPDAFTDDSDPYQMWNQGTDGDITIYDKNNKNNRIRMSIRDREYEKSEPISTPAGIFDTTKVKSNIVIRTPQETMNAYSYEWYSADNGIVRSEVYDENNVLQFYSVLEEIR